MQSHEDVSSRIAYAYVLTSMRAFEAYGGMCFLLYVWVFLGVGGMRLLSWTVRESEARPGQSWATRNLATQACIVHVVATGQNRPQGP